MTSEARRVGGWLLAILTVWPYLPLAWAWGRGDDLSEGSNGGLWHHEPYGGFLFLNWGALLLFSLIVLVLATFLRLLDRRVRALPSPATLGLVTLPWLIVAAQFLTLFWLVD